MQTSAIYGYASQVLRLIQEEKPEYLAVVKDLPGPTFRHEMYDKYKANRKPMPDELRAQLPYVDEFLDALGAAQLSYEGMEADDVIGTIAREAESEGIQTYIMTKDKDLMQIVGSHIFLYEPGARNQPATVKGPKEVREKFGVNPEQMVDLLALMGDSADNIPGVAKVGPKTAANLLEMYGSLDGIYENVDNISKKGLRQNLKDGKENAYLSRDLVVLNCNIPLKEKLAELKYKAPQPKKLNEFLVEMEMQSLLGFVPKGQNADVKVEEKAQAKKSFSWELVNSEEKLHKLLAQLQKADIIAVDTETTGLDVITAELVGFCLATNGQSGFYLPVGHKTGQNLSLEMAVKALKPILAGGDKTLIFHNAKYDLAILEKYGLELGGLPEGKLVDTLMAAYLENPGSRGLGLDALCEKYFAHNMIPIEELIGKKGKNQISFAEVELDKAAEYGAEDAIYTYKLYEYYSKKFKGKIEWELLIKDEIPLMLSIMSLEKNGICVNKDALASLSEEMEKEIAQREKNIFEMAGEEFNINSTQKLGEILFEKLKLKASKKTKTGYSTDASVLQGLLGEHPIIENLLDYREFTKLKNTYIDVLPGLVHPKTGRIHTSFSQTIAATGRLSSINPNLQNIPIRTDWGKKIRASFIPENKDKLLLAADYSQIELRVLAHLSEDEALMAAYQNGLDIHTQTASALYKVEEDKVTSDMRRSAKVVNFGVLYGMGPGRLSRELSIERKEASAFIENYFEKYSGVQKFIDNTIVKARNDGYVATITGRKRYLPDLASSNRMHKENSERIAVNTPIQGTAADIIKKAMVQLNHALKKSNLDCKMLLQVHDELVFEVAKEDVEESSKLISQIMENSIKLNVPLVVEIGSGTNWLLAHG